MGKIQESLVLTDGFTAAFTRFLSFGNQAVGSFDKMSGANIQFQQSSVHATQQIESMKAALDSQQTLLAAQNQRLIAQKTHVESLAQKYQALAASKGAEATATIRAQESLARAEIADKEFTKQVVKTSGDDCKSK